MSNYTKATNFATKDTLPTGDSGKIVKGTEIDTEFNAIASSISTKADIASPTFTGTPAAPTASSGTSSTQVATTAFVAGAITDERTATATLTNKTITSPVINEIVHEGTADDYETTIAFTDPTADRTITFPDKSGTVAMTSEVATASVLTTFSGTYAVAGSTTVTVTATAHGRTTGDVVYLNFTSGTLDDGYYTITGTTTNTFTFTYGSSVTTSGNVTGYYSNSGTIPIASTDETLAGTSTNRAVSPAGVIAAVRASIVQGTAQASTSGTTIDFTGIPSWAKKITVLFAEVSTSGTSEVQIQLGTGTTPTYTTTGYVGSYDTFTSAPGAKSITTGMGVFDQAASQNFNGATTIFNLSGNKWVSQTIGGSGGSAASSIAGSSVTLGAALTAIRITPVNGTDTFDSGSINIIYE